MVIARLRETKLICISNYYKSLIYREIIATGLFGIIAATQCLCWELADIAMASILQFERMRSPSGYSSGSHPSKVYTTGIFPHENTHGEVQTGTHEIELSMKL